MSRARASGRHAPRRERADGTDFATRDGRNGTRAGCSDDASAAGGGISGTHRTRSAVDRSTRASARNDPSSARGRETREGGGGGQRASAHRELLAARRGRNRIVADAACAPGARREDFARVDGKTRGVACVRTMSRSASVLPSPVAPLGPHMHHMTGRVAESPGRANGGPSQFRTGPSDDATGPDRQSGLRSPAAGGARPRRAGDRLPRTRACDAASASGASSIHAPRNCSEPGRPKLFRAEGPDGQHSVRSPLRVTILWKNDDSRRTTRRFAAAPRLRPCCSNSPCCSPP